MKKISMGNTLPAPMATELEGDEAERAWQAAMSGGGPEDATLPVPMDGPDTRPQEAPPALSFEEVLAEARRFNRACPEPRTWAQLYRILIRHAVERRVPPPTPPVDQQAWADTPSMSKRAVLRAQLEWADAFGCLALVHAFLVQMPDTQWTFIGAD